MAADGPTYCLVVKPNLTLEEVKLGSLLSNPRRPDNAFYVNDSWTFQKDTKPPKAFACKIDKSATTKVGFFASFAGLVGGSVDISHSKFEGKWLCAQKVEQESFRPADSFLQDLSRNADVQNHLVATGKKIVWLITGIKVGWNVSITDSKIESNETSGSLQGSVSGVGLGLSGQHKSGTGSEFHYWEPGPVVFGMEVMKLKVLRDGSFDASVAPGHFYGKHDDKPAAATIQLLPCGNEEADELNPKSVTKVDGYDESTSGAVQLLLGRQ